MSILDHIPSEALAAEGFVRVADTDAVIRAIFGTVPEIIDRRMDVPDIARWLQVSPYRLNGYIDDRRRAGVQVLDMDGCLSIRQIIRIDWSKLTNQKRTTRISGSNFQGRKRKTKPHKV
jgi:hypothetical protein